MTPFHPEILPLLLILLTPLALVTLSLIPRCRRFLPVATPWTALPALLVAWFRDPWLPPPLRWLMLDVQLGMDDTGKIFLGFTALVWMVAGFYAVHSMKKDKARTRFFVMYLLALTGNLGLIVAQDVVGFYLFFALMSFSSYGLVIHTSTPQAFRAGKVYMILVILGEALVLFGLLTASNVTGTTYFHEITARLAEGPVRHSVMLFCLLGFGVKAGLLPLHVWLPLAHPVAPTPASAVLSACMIKAGLLGWLRVFPLGQSALPEWGGVMMVLGMAGVFYGALVALTQDAPKTVLAYSSISQMGIMTATVGVGLALPTLWSDCWTLLMFYATHHALVKAALFLGAGVKTGAKASLPTRYLYGFGLLLPSAAIIGAPWTSGALAKTSLKFTLEEASLTLPAMRNLSSLLALATAGTFLIMARFLWLLRAAERSGNEKQKATPYGQNGAFALLVILVVLLPLATLMESAFRIPSRAAFFLPPLGSLWPILLGAGIAAVVIRKGWRKPFRIPEGDLVVFFTHLPALARPFLASASHPALRYLQWNKVTERFRKWVLSLSLGRIDALEDLWRDWLAFGLVFLMLAITFLAMIFLNVDLLPVVAG